MSDAVADRTAHGDSATAASDPETERSDTAADTGASASDDDRTDGTTDGSVTLTRKPTLVSSLAAAVAAIVAVLVAGVGSPAGLAFGAVGAGALGVGLAVGNRTAIDVGGIVLFFGAVVVSGLEATVVGPTVVGTIATVLAWDIAHTAIDIGEQLGREARTRRLEAVAIVSSLLVGLIAGTIGYAVFVAGAGGQPAAVVVLLLLAAALIIVGLGARRQQSGTRRSRHTERSRRQ